MISAIPAIERKREDWWAQSSENTANKLPIERAASDQKVR